jgi:hypothetical protein
MRTFGEVIAEARKKAQLTQRQLAAQIRNEEGKGISGPTSTISSITSAIRRVVTCWNNLPGNSIWISTCFIFLAKQLPPEIDMNNVSEEQGVAAYRAFRQCAQKKRQEEAMIWIPDADASGDIIWPCAQPPRFEASVILELCWVWSFRMYLFPGNQPADLSIFRQNVAASCRP